MDKAVIAYYRQLMRSNFEHFGAMDEPSVFIESVGDRLSLCGVEYGFMEIYLAIAGGVIERIQYRCSCDPIANVAVEILCCLLKGKTLAEAASLTEKSICAFLGTDDAELKARSRVMLALVNQGIDQDQTR